MPPLLGRLSQLVRESGLHPECRGFESLTAHQLFRVKNPRKCQCLRGFLLLWHIVNHSCSSVVKCVFRRYVCRNTSHDQAAVQPLFIMPRRRGHVIRPLRCEEFDAAVWFTPDWRASCGVSRGGDRSRSAASCRSARARHHAGARVSACGRAGRRARRRAGRTGG